MQQWNWFLLEFGKLKCEVAHKRQCLLEESIPLILVCFFLEELMQPREVPFPKVPGIVAHDSILQDKSKFSPMKANSPLTDEWR